MTNLEWLKSLDACTLGRILCDHTPSCGECLAQNKCYFGNNGYVAWLNSEKEIKQNEEIE